MEHFMEYWFLKYDNESFEREFSKVSYMDILAQLVQPLLNYKMVHPDFANLPNFPTISNDPNTMPLQICSTNILDILVRFFCDLNLDEGLTDPFSRYGRTVLAFLDCEKLYSIIFWNLGFIPMFLECRVNATLIRYYKFFMGFCQAVLTPDGVQQQQNVSNDGGRRMNIIIKRVAETNPRAGLYLEWKKLIKLQKDVVDQLRQVSSHTPTMCGKLCYFVSNMFDKSINDLRKICDQQYGNIETMWVQKILSQNNIAVKHIDSFIESAERNIIEDYNEDQDLFDGSQALKDLVQQAEKDYLPKDLKTKLYGEPGGEVEVNNEQRQKDQKRLIMEKLQKKDQRDRQRQERLEQNYMEKFRQERELVTAGTMVTQESGDMDFRPRKVRGQLLNEIMADNKDKVQEQVVQSRFTKFSESESYQKSPNNPQIMKGSVVAYLANDVFQPYYEQEEKKKKKEQEQQMRLNKMKETNSDKSDTASVHSHNQNTHSQTIFASTNTGSTKASTNMNDSSVTMDSNKLSETLEGSLMHYIRNADVSMIDIKDEDIAVEDGNKRRRYKIKKIKQNFDQNGSQNDIENDHRRVNPSSNSEVYEDEQKRLEAKQRLRDHNQVLLSQLKVTRIQEKQTDDVKDTDLFQYSYENSMDEDDIEEEEEKQKRLQKYKEKVPLPMNHAHSTDGILFEKVREWVGDTQVSKIRKVLKIQELFHVKPKRLLISSRTALPANGKWDLLRQMMNQKEIERQVAAVIGDNDWEDYCAPKSFFAPQTKILRHKSRIGQIF